MGTNTTWYCSNSNHFQPFSVLASSRRRLNIKSRAKYSWKLPKSAILLCSLQPLRQSLWNACLQYMPTTLYRSPPLSTTLSVFSFFMYFYHLFDAFIALLCFSANIGLTAKRLITKCPLSVT